MALPGYRALNTRVLNCFPKKKISALLDLDTCDSNSTASALQQSIENPRSEAPSTAEETQTRLIGAPKPTTSVLHPIADTNDSTPHPIYSTPELAIQKASESDTKGGDDQPKSEVKSMQELEDQLRFLRHKLQNGFLPTAGKPEEDEMKTMSAYLKKLEYIGDPPQSILRATSITKLLKKIRDLDEIPRNGRYFFKERAIALLQKWGTRLEQKDQTTSSTGHPTKHDSTGLSAIADKLKPAKTGDGQKLLDNETKTSATGLMGEPALDTTSEQSTSDHNDESARIPDNRHSEPTPPPSPAIQDSSKFKVRGGVIDLTDDDGVDMATGLELPEQTTNDQDLRRSAAKSSQALRSPSLPSSNSESVFISARKVLASPKSDSANLGTKKRKRSNATGRDIVSASGSSPEKHNAPKRQRPQRKTSPGKHLNNEILWMSDGVLMVQKIIENVKKEIETIKERRVQLLEQNETEMQSAQRRMNESIELKQHLLAWGAQDEKVTKEWSSSG